MIIDFRVSPPLQSVGDRPPQPVPYQDLYHFTDTFMAEYTSMSPEKFLNLIDQAGIAKVVIPGEDIETTFGTKIPNERLAEFCQHAPGRFIGFAGVDPYKGIHAIRELEYAVHELNLKGLNLPPFLHKLEPTDRRYYPLYVKCIELKVPVILHVGINFFQETSMQYSHPKYLDQIATDFPELQIIATHAGWPWIAEMTAVAWKHPNIYIDTAGQSPKYMALIDMGWGPLLRLGNSLLQDRILFATRFPLISYDRALEEFNQLPLKEEVKEKWLWKNASKLLKIEEKEK